MIDWIASEYGESWKMTLTATLGLSVTHEIGTKGGPPPPYRVFAFGAILTAKYGDPNEAKKAAISFARRQLRAALLALPDEAEGQKPKTEDVA